MTHPRRLGRSCWRAVLLAAAAGLAVAACSGLGLEDRIQTPSVYDEIVESGSVSGGPRRVADPGGGVVGDVQRFPQAARYPGDPVPGRPVWRGSGARETAQGFELNFNDVELSELVKIILRDTLKIGYAFDPRVKGRVTISTGRSATRDELIGILEAILAANGAALVQEGSQYQIIPESNAQASGVGAFAYAAEARVIGRGYGVTILPLRHVSADTILKLLAPFASKPGTIRSAAAGNLVYLRGSAAQRRSLLAVAATFDVDWMRGQSAVVYPLSHAAPAEIIDELTNVFRSADDGAGKGLIRFEPIERLNAVLVLSHRDGLLDQAVSWMQRLDKTNVAGPNYYVYAVEHADADNLANVLNAAFGNSRASTDSPRSDVAPDEDVVASSIGGGDPGAVPEPTTPGASQTSSFEPAPSPASDGKQPVRIVADSLNNKLLIYANGRAYRRVLGMLRRLDRVPTQVLINATLAEVTLNDNLRYGVQLFLREQEGPIRDIIGFSNGDSIVIQPELPGLNILAGVRGSPKAILDALANETHVRVVSSPSVVVRNNRTAKLQVGDEVPIATRQAVSVTDPEAPIVNNIEFRETGVILKVTPQISSNGLVNMKIEQEISNVASTTTQGAAGTLTPTISQRRVESEISVYGGQMVVLAGLISERRSGLKNRVPLWEKIPIIGKFPGKTERGLTRTELVIFLIPHVIANPADASLIAEELKERMRSLEPNKRRKYKRWPTRERERAQRWSTEVVQ